MLEEPLTVGEAHGLFSQRSIELANFQVIAKLDTKTGRDGTDAVAEIKLEIRNSDGRLFSCEAGTVVVGEFDLRCSLLPGQYFVTVGVSRLDDDGKEIENAVLRVSSNVRHLTTIFYGRQRQTFSCAPTCEQVILVGDDPVVFKNATEQIQGRQAFAGGQ